MIAHFIDWFSTVILGTTFGLMLCINVIGSNALFLIKNDSVKIEQWRFLYHQGKLWVLVFTVSFLILSLPGLLSDFTLLKAFVIFFSLIKVPFTYVVMAPTNNILLDSNANIERSVALLPKWRKLHYVRIITEFIAFGLHIWAFTA